MKKLSFAYGITGAALSFFFAIMTMSGLLAGDSWGLPQGLLSVVGAVIGVTGVILLGHNKLVAAIMMFVAAAANIIDTLSLGASVFLVIGAVLTLLIKDDEEDVKPYIFRTLSLTFSILGGAALIFFLGSIIKADMLSYIGQADVVTITFIRLLAAFVGALGGIFIFRKRLVSIILMLAGAAAIIIAAPDSLNIAMLAPSVLFVIGAVFALIPEKKQPAPVPEAEA